MSISLKSLFEDIYQATDEDEMRSQLSPKIGEYFAAKRSGVFFFDQLLTNRKLHSVLRIALSVDHNPLACYIAERHTPVHEGLVTTPKAWRLICTRPDHWHVMAGPIVSRGQVVGSVGCTREKSMPAFNNQDLADLGAICLHLSAWAAGAQSVQGAIRPPQQSLNTHRLTPRELQIANLVALGRTNAEIGNELWITENSVKQALKRMFRKLEVSSRAEMAAQISATPAYYLNNKPPSPSSVPNTR